MSFHFVRTRVEIQLAKTAWPEADALILPTNDYLWMAAGPALDLKKRAGEDVELAAVRLGPISLGEAVIADAGTLPLSGIIHAAVMGQDLHVDAEAATRAIVRALGLAVGKRWGRLLVHSIHAATHGKSAEATRGTLKAVLDFLLDGPPVQQVTFLAGDDAERILLHQEMLRLIQSHG